MKKFFFMCYSLQSRILAEFQNRRSLNIAYTALIVKMLSFKIKKITLLFNKPLIIRLDKQEIKNGKCCTPYRKKYQH